MQLRKLGLSALLLAGVAAIVAPVAISQPNNPYVLTAAKIATALGYTPANNTVISTGSTTSRTLANRFASRVSVLDFGANNTGTPQTATNINTAVVAAAAGGNCLWFPPGVYLITTSIVVVQGACLEGPGAIVESAAGAAVIRAGANLATLLTNADSAATNTHSVTIRGITFDGNKASFTVTDIVKLGFLNGYFEGNYVVNGSGNCIRSVPGTNAATDPGWIHWISRNTVGNCTGVGIYEEATDSIISENYVSGNTVGNILVSTGTCAVRISANQIESSAGYGLKVTTPASTVSTFSGCTIVGNEFNQVDTGIWLAKGAAGATMNVSRPITGNTFVASTTYDIRVDSNLTYGIISGNNMAGSTPATAHIAFGGTNNTNWFIENLFGTATKFVNKPADATVIEGGNSLRTAQLGNTVINPLTGEASLRLDPQAASYAVVRYASQGVPKWDWSMDQSTFALYAYNQSGVMFNLDFVTGIATFGASLVTKGYTVATLPAAPGTGARTHVTDQLTACPVLGGAFTGEGAVACPAFYNGAAWIHN